MGLRRGARQQDEQRGDAQRAAAGHGVHQAEASLETRVQPAVHLSRALRHLPPRLLRLTVAGPLIITEIITAVRHCCLFLNGPTLVIPTYSNRSTTGSLVLCLLLLLLLLIMAQEHQILQPCCFPHTIHKGVCFSFLREVLDIHVNFQFGGREGRGRLHKVAALATAFLPLPNVDFLTN